MKIIYELTPIEKSSIKADAIKRSFWQTPFTFYIENCLAINNCPKWFWSFISEVIFLTEEQSWKKW